MNRIFEGGVQCVVKHEVDTYERVVLIIADVEYVLAGQPDAVAGEDNGETVGCGTTHPTFTTATSHVKMVFGKDMAFETVEREECIRAASENDLYRTIGVECVVCIRKYGNRNVLNVVHIDNIKVK